MSHEPTDSAISHGTPNLDAGVDSDAATIAPTEPTRSDSPHPVGESAHNPPLHIALKPVEDAALRHTVFVAALFIVIAGLKLSATLLVPMLMAAFVAIISWPLVALTRKIPRLPDIVGTIAVFVVILGIFTGIGFAIVTSARGFVNDSAMYAEKINERFGSLFTSVLERIDPYLPEDTIQLDLAHLQQYLNPGLIFSNLSKIINELSGAISSGVLVLIILAFMLLEISVLPRKLEAMQTSSSRMGRFQNIVEKIQTYILVKSALSLGTSLMTGVAIIIVQVPYPGIWMLLTFVLNFVPVFGSLMASIPPVILALIFGGLPAGIAVALTYMAANFFMDNMIEPRLMGHTLGLSPLVVFLALLFWGWVFGPIGMVLSTPLTMIVKIMLDDSPQFRDVAILLSSGSKKELERVEQEAL